MADIGETARATVFLVGAGPGDPELLTVKAQRLIETADVVVYDRLVSDEIMALVPDGASRINVGKQPNCHPVPQDEINQLLASLAKPGRVVVRLKGGDPFLFGRGSEEAAHLHRHGIDYRVVPGVTSASGCAASIGLPLTHRGVARGVRFVTGHCREDEPLDFDWRGLADPETTLVIYMGRTNMAQIAVRLIAEGLSADTPVLAVSKGTLPAERHVIAPLGEISATVAAAALDGPMIFIIGNVAGLTAELGIDTNASVRLPSMRRFGHG